PANPESRASQARRSRSEASTGSEGGPHSETSVRLQGISQCNPAALECRRSSAWLSAAIYRACDAPFRCSCHGYGVLRAFLRPARAMSPVWSRCCSIHRAFQPACPLPGSTDRHRERLSLELHQQTGRQHWFLLPKCSKAARDRDVRVVARCADFRPSPNDRQKLPGEISQRCGSSRDALGYRGIPCTQLCLTSLFVVQDILNQITALCSDVARRKRFEPVKRNIRTNKGEQRIPSVGRRLHANEVFKRVMLAVRTAKRRILRTITRRAEMFGFVVGREIDQQHHQFCVQVGVWTKKVSGAMTNELRLDRRLGPLGAMRAERLEHCLCEVGAEKPFVE